MAVLVDFFSNYNWTILLSSAGVLLYLMSIRNQKWWPSYKNLPPFPITPLPIVGNLLAVKDNPRQQIQQWRKQVGDIFTLKMLGNIVVVVNGYARIKEISVKNGQRCSDRPLFFHDTITGTAGLGIGTSSGPQWKEERATANTILKSFGMGNGKRDEHTEQEVQHFLEELEKQNGKAINIRHFIKKASCNTITLLLFGKRVEYEDKDLGKVVDAISDCISKSASKKTQVLQFCPMLVYLPGDFFDLKDHLYKIILYVKWLNNTFIKDTERKAKDNFDFDNSTNNYMLSYAKERQRKEKSGSKTYMNSKTLLKSVADLLTAGTETTASTLTWFVLFMVKYPSVQQKAFDEIEKHVGTERLPNMDDKPNLTYVNAAIMESQRLGNVNPLPAIHVCSEDVEFAGYTLPKGTHVSINLDSVLHDESIWGQDAKEYRPERFIDENGRLIHRPEFVPFSIGRRQCVGEGFAKTQLFMFVSCMIQRFKFNPEVPGVFPPLKDDFGASTPPAAFLVRCIDRRTIH